MIAGQLCTCIKLQTTKRFNSKNNGRTWQPKTVYLRSASLTGAVRETEINTNLQTLFIPLLLHPKLLLSSFREGKLDAETRWREEIKVKKVPTYLLVQVVHKDNSVKSKNSQDSRSRRWTRRWQSLYQLTRGTAANNSR